MSNGLHPHWHSDADEKPVHISVKSSAEPAQSAPAAPKQVTVSRKPAAFAGILLVVAAVLSVYGTASIFQGQANKPPPKPKPKPAAIEQGPTVTITDAGFDPQTLTVKPGDTVTWKNTSTIPHILTSETLETADGPMETSPIFPETSLAVTIAADAKVGTYTYISQTSQLEGTIELSLTGANTAPAGAAVSSKAPAMPTSSAPAVPDPQVQQPISSVQPVAAVSVVSSSSSSLAPIPVPVSSVAPPPPPPVSSAAPIQNIPVIPTAAVGTIPRNPYAINRPTYVEPVQTGSVSSASSESMHGGAPISSRPAVTQHKPTSQPDTGSGDWAVAVMAMIAVATLAVQACKSKAWTYQS